MATMNSSVLPCGYVLSGGSDLNLKLASVPTMAGSSLSANPKLLAIRAQQAQTVSQAKGTEGRRAALVSLAAIVFTATATTSSANSDVFVWYLEKSKANKELNDKKRLATSGANFTQAYTVEFGSCMFPENFTGCQDLAKQKF